MGKLARITWPQEYSELQRIEELLLCGICYDYMDTSVMTPCSHNYCSLCIRKYLHYKTQCPACFEKTFEKDLHTNRILDDLILYFGKIRLKLVDCIAGAKIETDEESVQNSPRFTPVRPARMNQNQKKTPIKVETKQNEVATDSEGKVENLVPIIGTPQKMLSSPSTSGVTKMAAIFTPKSKKNSAIVATLPCPVCKVEVSEINMNKHLDDCLKRETASQEPARTEKKRKPLPKLVFSLMKDMELRKKIKELGLPTQGDRKTLEARFQRYSTLYNAECDKREPRPVEELLRQCDEEEALEKKMLKSSQAANRLKINRNTEKNVIEEAQKKYLESNKKNYQSLIAAIKDREKPRKSSVRRSLIKQELDDPSSESTAKLIPQNNTNHLSEDEELNHTSYPVNAYDANFQDSDSDTCCTLQHYTSDDPISFLSIQMSVSGNSNDNSIQTSSKSSPLKTLPYVKKTLDTSASPAKDVTLSKDNSGLMTEESLKSEVEDIFNATTDTESNDEDLVIPTPPKAATSHSTKRAKLSLRKLPNTDKSNDVKNNQDKLEGKKLALSIARDFTFDTSSNESVGSEDTHETVNTKPTEKLKDETHKGEEIQSALPIVDKENHKSSTMDSIAVNRPLRKRNCVIRAQSMKDKSINAVDAAPDEALRTSADENVLSSVTRNDSPVKRRRRRKAETANAPLPKDPPSRPLRKRNSVVKDNVHQRS